MKKVRIPGRLESVIAKFTTSANKLEGLKGGLHANVVHGKPIYPNLVFSFVTGQTRGAFRGSGVINASIDVVLKGKDYKKLLILTDELINQLYQDNALLEYTLQGHSFHVDDKVQMIALQLVLM